MTAKWKCPDSNYLIKLYQSGESVNALSKRYKITGNAIRSALRELGIRPRTRSEAEFIKNAQRTEDERKAQTKAANRGRRGNKDPMWRKIKRAVTRCKRVTYATPQESILKKELERRNIKAQQQTPCLQFNLDLTIDDIAVEIHSTHYLESGKERRRLVKVLNEGWHIICVNTGPCCLPIDAVAVTNQIISIRKILRRNPSSPRKYWMIRSNGDVSASGSYDGKTLTVVGRSRGHDKIWCIDNRTWK